MIQILKDLFDASPEKSRIVLKEKCSDCGCETVIKITCTSEGFGLQGGILLKHSPDGYLAKCPSCYEANSKIDDDQKR